MLSTGNRGWSFLKHRTKPPLTAKEVLYWKRFFRNVLKVGLEFEFNLPESNGHCDGTNISCTCIHFEKGCWKECANLEDCQANNGVAMCANVTGTCELEDCATCAHFKATCNPGQCGDFSPFCAKCEDFEMNCAKCPQMFNPELDPNKIRQKMIEDLHPCGFYGKYSKTGVHSIVPDGSLQGQNGAEVITLGRRPDYWLFYDMAKSILDAAVGRGAYTNERTSMHMHVLATYYSKLLINGSEFGIPDQVTEMEKDLPEIIAANIHQLTRKYQNVLTWLTVGLSEKNRLTRWEKFRVSVLEVSAARNSMMSVNSIVKDMCHGKKYGFINWTPTSFADNGDITRLHYEMRQADCLLAPSAVAALACLHYAIAVKAVEISRYGVLIAGDEGWMKKAKAIKKRLLNNNKGYQDGDRFAHTEGLDEYYEDLARESHELLAQVKHILMDIGPAFEVLERMADKPCALRRVEGHGWERIESDLAVERREDVDEFEEVLCEVMDLRHVQGCDDVGEWLDKVADLLLETADMGKIAKADLIAKAALYLSENSDSVIWSTKIGAMMLR
jgi:predicted metal-dependent hydrolase